jgi:hypothetical protein
MSLENYFKNAWLKKKATSPQEIADQLGLVSRCIKDSSVEGISDNLRSKRPSARCWLSPIPHFAPAAMEIRRERSSTSTQRSVVNPIGTRLSSGDHDRLFESHPIPAQAFHHEWHLPGGFGARNWTA